MNAKNHTPESNNALLSNDELTQLLAISGEIEDEMQGFTKSNTHHLYMQFLQISLANKPTANLAILTLNEQHLLEQIAIRCEMGNPVSVTEACQMRQFGCISTVHHKIQKLNALGLIFLDADHVDLHKKFITLSANGLNYFKQIEDCLDMALMLQ